MDGQTFDRLSVVVHRQQETRTRRGALGLVIGGALAATSTLLAHDAGAKHKHQRSKNTGVCWGGRCWPRRGGRNSCGGQDCPAGWGCCGSRGVSVCVPHTFPTCCGSHSFTNGYTCCGGFGGACLGGLETCTGQFGICCQPGWKHCQNSVSSTCIPNTWHCDQFFNQSRQSAGITAASEEHIPSTDPVLVPATDWIELPQA